MVVAHHAVGHGLERRAAVRHGAAAAHHADDLVIVHGVAKGHDLLGRDAVVVHDLRDAARLGDPHLQGIDPAVAGGREHEFLTQLALEHVGVVHHVAVVAEDRGLENVHLGVGQLPDALGVGQVLVHLAHELVLVIHQKRLGAVKERQVQVVEHADHARQVADGQMRVHLAVDLLALGIDLRAVGRHKVHLVHHGLEEGAKAIVAAAGRCGKTNAPLAQGDDELVGLGRHLAVLVQQRSVHVRGDQFDHALQPPCCTYQHIFCHLKAYPNHAVPT